MPPYITDSGELADVSESLVPAQSDLSATELTGIDPAPADLVEAEGIGGAPVQEASTPAADETAVSTDLETPGRDPDLWLYRERTVAILRRYMRLSIEVGRMPSLLGREFFRTRVTAYKSSTFEDSAIFVHDVERSLEELSEFEKKLIAKIVLQRYSKEEAGRLLGCGYRTVERLLPETLDRVSEIFLGRGILTRLPTRKREVPKSCQGGKTDEFLTSD